MEVYIKKYFWTLGVVVTVVCAVLAARGFNHVVEAKYLMGGGRAGPEKPDIETPARKPDKPQRSKSGQPLADKNMFCAECEPPEPVDPVKATDPDKVPKTNLPLELVATNVSSSKVLSFATIRNSDSDKQGAYWIEEKIPEAGKIIRITGAYVDFLNEDAKRVERISLLDKKAPPTRTRSRPKRRTRRKKRDNKPKNELQAMLDEGIKKTGENSYEVDRELVNKVLSNPAKVARGARIVPSIKNGKANGFKLYAIRPSSVYANIGLMNGDTINQVNGFELTTPDKALEVYTKVREANNLSVRVTRRGKPVTLKYRIR